MSKNWCISSTNAICSIFRRIFNKNFEFEDVMDDMDNLHTHVNTGIVTVVWLKQAIAGYTSSVKIAQHRFRSDPKFEPRIRRLNPYSIKFFCETLPLQITNIFLETNQLYFYTAISKCVLFWWINGTASIKIHIYLYI